MSEQSKNNMKSIREFHRHYLDLVNMITRDYDDSEVSISEIRVLHEIEKLGQTTCKELSKNLSIDSGYMSRIVTHLGELGFIAKHANIADGRSTVITLTPKGNEKLTESNEHFDDKISEVLSGMPEDEQTKLINNIVEMEKTLTSWKSFGTLGC